MIEKKPKNQFYSNQIVTRILTAKEEGTRPIHLWRVREKNNPVHQYNNPYDLKLFKMDTEEERIGKSERFRLATPAEIKQYRLQNIFRQQKSNEG